MFKNLRSGDDDLGVNHLLLEDTALTLLVGGGHESVSLVLEPLADTELVLCGTKETGLLFGVLLALIEAVSVFLQAVLSYLQPIEYSHHTSKEEPCPVARKRLSVF
jgi:hypothetical protein